MGTKSTKRQVKAGPIIMSLGSLSTGSCSALCRGLLFGLSVCLAYWLMDALWDWYFLADGGLASYVVQINSHELVTRLSSCVLILGLAIIYSLTAAKQRGFSQRLEEQSGELAEFNVELAALNEELEAQNEELNSQNDELQLTKASLKQSNREYQDLFNGMQDGFALHEIVCDERGLPVDYRFLEVNPAFERLTGLSESELRGRTVREVLPKTESHWIEKYGAVALTGEATQFEAFSVELGRHFRVIAYSPEPNRFACLFQDITDRIQFDTNLRRSEERFRKLFEGSHDLIHGFAPDGRLLFANPAWQRALGYTESEIKTLSVWDVVASECKEACQQRLQQLREDKTVGLFEAVLTAKNDRRIIVEGSIGAIHSDNELVGFQAICRDITVRRRNEDLQQAIVTLQQQGHSAESLTQLMQMQIEYLRTLTGCECIGIRWRDGEDYPYYESAGFPIDFILAESQLCALDQHGKLLRDNEGNPVLECMCGNVLRQRFDPQLPFFTDDGSFWTNSTTKLLASTSETDRQARTRNRCNGEGYESVALIPLIADNHNQPLGLLQVNDLRPNRFTPELIAFLESIAPTIAQTINRRLADQELKRELEINQAMVDVAKLLLDPSNSIERITSVILDTARHLTDCDHGYVSSIDPTTKDNICHTFTQMLQTQACQITGEDRKVAFSPNRDGKYAGLWGHSLNVGRSFFTNSPTTHPASIGLPEGHITVVNFLSVPAFIADEVVGQICLANSAGGFREGDLHAIEQLTQLYALVLELKRYQSELVKNANQLRQVQKLEAIGTLASGIAHDFNNILFAVMGNVDLATESLDKPELARENLETAMKACRRAVDLVKQILAFARKSESQRRSIDAIPLIKEACQMIRAMLPATIHIDLKLELDSAIVVADPSEVNQLLVNLCTNASQAMSATGGRLAIKVCQREIDEYVVKQQYAMVPGNYLLLSISDTGVGISANHLEKIFDPFFTTKAVGEGTGLGLSVVHGIVTSLGGEITAYSEVGSGSTFNIYLPIISGVQVADVELDAELSGGTEHILVVDDEAMIANVVQEMLQRLGYEVTAYSDPYLALDAVRQAPHEFDLIITDQTMPGLTGLKLLRAIAKIRDDLPAILSTGLSQTELESELRSNNMATIAMKPLTRADLAVKVRHALDASK